MIPKALRTLKLDGNIWNVIPVVERNSLFLEVRDVEKKSANVSVLDLTTLELLPQVLPITWWNKLIGAKDKKLYFIDYKDRNDPNEQSFFSVGFDFSEQELASHLPIFETNAVHPHVYEPGTEYHQTVSKFMGLELSLGCEYLEWGSKIIISYYLRSGNGFDRYLLSLNNGKKEWKIVQDSSMKGFSSGSFFVFNDQVIFIKNQNEVCVHNM